MASFEIQGPDGATYEVEAPDERSAVAAMRKMSEKPATWGDTVADVAKSAGRGVMEGAAAVAGLPGDIAGGLDWIGNKAFDAARNLIAGPREPEKQAAIDKARADLPRFLPSSRDVIGAADSVTGGALEYSPRTTAGEYARTVGSFIPGAVTLGGGIGTGLRGALGAASKYGILPGLASEAGGQLTEGKPYEPFARVAGALIGATAPALVRRAVTPFPASRARQAAARTMQREGVDLTGGQATGNTALRYTESELGGARGAQFMERQGEQFTAAALRRAGIGASRATPEVIDGAFRRIGNQFERLSRGNQLIPDRAFVNDLKGALKWYADRVSQPNRAPIIANYADEIANAVKRGGVPGEAYQSLRSRIATDARGIGDPYVKLTLRDLAETLDDAMERSIAGANPSALGAWQEARRQYRNLLVIEKAATGAGENAALGLISPSQLRAATVNQGRRAYARGQGDFADLARAGEATMKPLPNSGTPGRLRAQTMIYGIPAAIGSTVGANATGDLPGGLLGLVAGAALPMLAGRAIMAPAGRSYLSNQLWQPPVATGQALAAALANASLRARTESPAVPAR